MCSVWVRVQRAPKNGHPNRKQGISVWRGGWRCDACQRPTLTGAGSLEKVAGLATLGPRNTLLQHQLHSVCTRRLLLMLHFQIPFVSEPSKGR